MWKTSVKRELLQRPDGEPTTEFHEPVGPGRISPLISLRSAKDLQTTTSELDARGF